MDFSSIKSQIKGYREEGKRLFASSSFQTHSLPLLHILSRIDTEIPVYFLNTGYLFPETLSFQKQIAQLLGLRVIPVRSDIPKNRQRTPDNRLLFASDPEYCCYVNKVLPMEKILASHDVWINGVRSDQTSARKKLNTFEDTPFRCVRFHPMLDWNKGAVDAYLRKHDLPSHPLDAKGYRSIGCEPCTRKVDATGDQRQSRWFGLKKTECGLHTDLVEK